MNRCCYRLFFHFVFCVFFTSDCTEQWSNHTFVVCGIWLPRSDFVNLMKPESLNDSWTLKQRRGRVGSYVLMLKDNNNLQITTFYFTQVCEKFSWLCKHLSNLSRMKQTSRHRVADCVETFSQVKLCKKHFMLSYSRCSLRLHLSPCSSLRGAVTTI